MSSFQLILLFAVPLESLRLFFVWREVSQLAREKGEIVETWAAAALGLWLGVVGGSTMIAFFFFRSRWLIVFFTSIVLSSILYRHLIKRPLERKPALDWDEKIDGIGKEEEEMG